MKRKASSASDDAADEAGEPRRAPPRIDDNLLAEEILPRLPVSAAAACAAGSTLRGILTSPDYWRVRNRRRRLPAGPRAACLVVRGCDDGGERFRHEFHYADAAAETPAVVRSVSESPKAFHYAGTCNGLVLLAPPWDYTDRVRAVLFNPATGEEETVVVDMADGDGNGNVYRCFCGIGYSPSSKTYKALVCATDFNPSVPGEPYSSVELLVVPLGGGGGQEQPRVVATVAKMCVSYSFHEFPCSLSTEGKVYVLAAADDRAPAVQAFDVEYETVTAIPPPPSAGAAASELMEVWGRPCIATCDARNTAMLWVLAPEHHRWERRCVLGLAPYYYMMFACSEIHGAWDCGEGLLFVLFRDGRGSTYDLRGTSPEQVTTARDLPEDEVVEASLPELEEGSFCWGYQPTLVHTATVFGDGEFYGKTPRPWCLEAPMELMRKRTQSVTS